MDEDTGESEASRANGCGLGLGLGLQAKLTAINNTSINKTVPSLFLANKSRNNKLDELQLRITSHRLNYGVMVITETWLDQYTPDAAIAPSAERTGPLTPVCAEEEDSVYMWTTAGVQTPQSKTLTALRT